MIYIQIIESLKPEDAFSPVDEGLLERAALETLLVAGGSQEADLTLVLADDAQLHELNRQFLGIDAPTDVLSFPSGEKDPDSEVPYLGDIVISLERAQAQAAAAGHSTESELQLLVVHGVLHLLGYDHADEDEMEAMWARQSDVLARLGIHDLGSYP